MVIAVASPAFGAGLASWVAEIPGAFRGRRVDPKAVELGRVIVRERPSVVVIDSAFTTHQISELLGLARAAKVAVVVVQHELSALGEVALVGAGARAAVRSDISRAAFRRLVVEVSDGQCLMSTEAMDLLTGGVIVDGLSPRQVAILRLLAEGASYVQIAESLLVSTSTVKTDAALLAERLGVRGQAALASRARDALAAGLLRAD